MSSADTWRKLSSADFREGRLNFERPGCTIATKFVRGGPGAKTLVVWFHAAVDRTKMKPPIFFGIDRDFTPVAHQISVSDPTLGRADDLRLGWYAGHEGLDAQGELVAFFAELAAALGVARTVYIGGSGGGFAAMHFSWRHAGSCAIALQPQTHIAVNAYHPRYLERCWPGLAADEVARRHVGDLCSAYAAGFGNTVIYLQSIADHRSYWQQLVPFQYAVRNRTTGHVCTHVDFWGALGHANIPKPVVASWLRAAIESPTLATDDLVQAQFRIRAAVSPEPAAAAAVAAAPDAAAAADVALADRLRDLALGRTPPPRTRP